MCCRCLTFVHTCRVPQRLETRYEGLREQMAEHLSFCSEGSCSQAMLLKVMLLKVMLPKVVRRITVEV